MAGIINTAQQPATQGVSDPILQKIQSGIDAKVTPQLKKQYLSIVVSGMKVILSPQFSQRILQKLKSSQNIASDVSTGIANIIATIYNEVGKNMSPQEKQLFVAASGPASTTLMCQVLDIAEKTIGIKVDSDMAAQCAQSTAIATLQKFGIDQAKMQQAVAVVQQKQGA